MNVVEMTPKERVYLAMALEGPKPAPASTFVTEVWAVNRRGESLAAYTSKPRELAEVIIETARRDDSDVAFILAGCTNLPLGALGARLKFPAVGSVDVEGPLVSSLSDVDSLDPSRVRADAFCRAMWETASLVNRAIGHRYLVAVNCRAPFTLSGGLRGVEAFLRDIYKNRELAHRVLDLAAETCWQYARPFIDAGIEVIYLSDPSASGDLISRRHFAEFAAPYLKRVMSRIRQAGARILLHICGNIGDRLDIIGELAPDILSVDYKVDLGLAREKLGHKICIAGNVDPIGVLEHGSLADVARVAGECLARGGPGFILLPGCEAPLGVPEANLRAFLAAARGGAG